jgi:excinuclease ABC subunit B
VETLERIEIMEKLRQGYFDVLIGVNLLREGLDLPEVSLVAILDADKEGFLRSHRSLTQTAGRAARNINGRVIFYADKITDSMQKTITETERRREKQLLYNAENNITPQQIIKTTQSTLIQNVAKTESKAYIEKEVIDIAADPVVKMMTKEQLRKSIEKAKRMMMEAAKKLEFLEAAQYRDELIKLEELMKNQYSKD